jgi:hypothetical protein
MTFRTAKAISEFEGFWSGVKYKYEAEQLTGAAVDVLAAAFPVIAPAVPFFTAVAGIGTIGSTISGRLVSAAKSGKSKYGNTFHLDYNYLEGKAMTSDL